MATETLRAVRERCSEYVDRVEHERERVVVTREGRPAAVLINPDELESLEETLSVLADGDAVRALRGAQDTIAGGGGVRGVSAVRALRPPRRR